MLSNQYQKLLKCEPLSEEETMAIIAEVHAGNKEKAWDLVRKNTRLVYRVLTHGFPNSINDDAFSDGLLGLYYAITRMRKGSYFGHFVRYSVSYIRGYILSGIQIRMSQLSPSRIETCYKKYRIEISKDNIIKGYNGGDLPVFYRFFDPLDKGPAEEFSDKDRSEFIKKIARHAYRTRREALIFTLLGKYDGDVTRVAKEIKKSRQYVHTIKNCIRRNLVGYFKDNPYIAEEFFGKNFKYSLTNKKIVVK